MRLVAVLGFACIGLLWGWWIGNLSGRITRPVLVGLMLCISSLLLAIEIFVLAGWWALLFFLGAGGFASILHIEWRKELINRFGPPRL